MKNSKVLKVILFLSGLLLIKIGGAFLFIPVEFSAKDGIEFSSNISLLNNVRSSSNGERDINIANKNNFSRLSF